MFKAIRNLRSYLRKKKNDFKLEKFYYHLSKENEKKVIQFLKNKKNLDVHKGLHEPPVEYKIFEKASAQMLERILGEISYSRVFFTDYSNSFGVPIVAMRLIENDEKVLQVLEKVQGEVKLDFPCNFCTQNNLQASGTTTCCTTA